MFRFSSTVELAERESVFGFTTSGIATAYMLADKKNNNSNQKRRKRKGGRGRAARTKPSAIHTYRADNN